MHFDAVARLWTVLPSRRDVLRGFAGAGLGLGFARLSGITEAKKKRKHKKRKPKKPTPNEFGCLEVGDACATEDQCCSGICEGKKGKKQCRAHDTGTCDQQAPGVCEAGNPYAALCNGGECACFSTTAGSNVCAQDFSTSVCSDCQKDADCLALGFPPGSACAPIWGDFACADLCENGMACMIPCGYEPPEQ
jgi:hypothetical protein